MRSKGAVLAVTNVQPEDLAAAAVRVSVRS
jgi:hypothetical protein